MLLFGSPNVGKLKAAGNVEELIQALGHKKSSVRRDAATALGQIVIPIFHDARAIDSLIAALQDADKDVRGAAATALGQIRDPRAIDPLIATFTDQADSVHHAAEAALGQIGAPAVEPLIAALSAEEWSGLSKTMGPALAAIALTLIGAPAVEPLIAALKDADKNVRFSAAMALGHIGDIRAVEPLIDALKDKEIRYSAAMALGRIGDARAVMPLIAVLKRQKGNVRSAAATALGQLGDARAIEPLNAALTDADKDVRRCAAEALRELVLQAAIAQAVAGTSAAAGARAVEPPPVVTSASPAPETGTEGKTPAVARYQSVAPEKTKRAVTLVEEYVNKDHPLDATMRMLGVKPTRPIYNVVQNQVQRGSHPHIDMKIVSVASCLPGEDIDVRDPTKVARLALEAIQHYASIPNVQAFFLLPYRLGAKTVVKGSAIPPEETCRVYSGVENLLLEIYDELPNGGTITDKVVEQKIDELIKSVQ